MKNFQNNSICRIFDIEYPVIQGGMVWCSGYKLASAVSNAGGLGLLGAGSMTPELLEEHIIKCKQSTEKPFGVNLPLIHRNAPALIEVILKQKVKIVFTSAGNPAQWTQVLKASGCKVVHVIANSRFAQKAADSGVDAIVAEGFEAGGHNGREETTTFSLLPIIRKVTDKPIIAAGGMYDGSSMLAAFALGASGIQLGSRFAVCEESSAHENFKKYVIDSEEGVTRLLMKRLIPVRLMLNSFAKQVVEAEASGASMKQLTDLLGSGRCKKGVFEGDLEEGELEIGQIAARINKMESAAEIVNNIVDTYFSELNRICG
ncbi:MAG: nitronate monooxygenase [Bacteroidales bacterium]|nr:nitronate monooxygenase [Bacteroidales bacterium]MBN2821104.1 nitronate monooxygenase [Bacteroidales bacterium]